MTKLTLAIWPFCAGFGRGLKSRLRSTFEVSSGINAVMVKTVVQSVSDHRQILVLFQPDPMLKGAS